MRWIVGQHGFIARDGLGFNVRLTSASFSDLPDFHGQQTPAGSIGEAKGFALALGSTPISRTVVKELQPSDPAWPPFAASLGCG
ncbi:hypothetical protein, partial [Xanthomonas euvesicatoria]